MIERIPIVGVIFESLAHREIEMEAILFGQIAPCKLQTHGVLFPIAEPKGFQIRETPEGFAELGRQLDALAVSRDAVLLPARGGERMSVAQPDFRMLGMRF